MNECFVVRKIIPKKLREMIDIQDIQSKILNHNQMKPNTSFKNQNKNQNKNIILLYICNKDPIVQTAHKILASNQQLYFQNAAPKHS